MTIVCVLLAALAGAFVVAFIGAIVASAIRPFDVWPD